MSQMTIPMTDRQPSRILAVLRGFFTTVRVETDYQRTRRELEALDDRALADIGLTRGMIDEVARSFTAVPADHNRI